MTAQILQGDVLAQLATLPDESVNCCVTSPPYWGLRDYGVAGQIGLEETPELYVARLVEVFREIRRVLRSDGVLWLNLGDSYATGAGKVGNCPGGGEQGDRWNGHRGSRGGSEKQPNTGSVIRPGTQPNRLPIKGLKPKDLVGVPWRVAFALQADGWYLRSDIIWNKPNPMPESVTDRPTKAHEYIFLLTKSERYFYDHEAIKEPANGWNGSAFDGERDLVVRPTTGRNRWKERKDAGEGPRRGFSQNQGSGFSQVGIADGETRNKRSVWTVATQPWKEAHFATFPEALIEPCILAGSPIGGTVLDPFSGSGTTGVVALRHQRNYIGIELNPDYVAMSERRLARPDQVEMELTA